MCLIFQKYLKCLILLARKRIFCKKLKFFLQNFKKGIDKSVFIVYYITVIKKQEAMALQQIGKLSVEVPFCYLKVTSKNHSALDAQSDFTSDCIEISQAYCRMSRNLCAR